MARSRFAVATTLYVAVVALLTVAGRFSPYRGDLAAFLAVALTLPAGLVQPALALIPHHLGWFAQPVVALLNAFLLRAAHRALPPDRVRREVQSRLDDAVVASRLRLTPMAREDGRRRRSLLLRDVPIEFPRLVGVYLDVWQESGLRVQRQAEPLLLRAYDRQGYEFSLEPGPGVFGDAVLRVTAPPAGHRAFLSGIVLAGLPAAVAALAGTLSVLLLIGCSAVVAGLSGLAAPRARSLGRGLLVSGTAALLVLVLFTAR